MLRSVSSVEVSKSFGRIRPVPGLVIRYAFLWSREAKSGSEDGSRHWRVT